MRSLDNLHFEKVKVGSHSSGSFPCNLSGGVVMVNELLVRSNIGSELHLFISQLTFIVFTVLMTFEKSVRIDFLDSLTKSGLNLSLRQLHISLQCLTGRSYQAY